MPSHHFLDQKSAGAIIARLRSFLVGRSPPSSRFVTDGLFINPKTRKATTGIVQKLMQLAEEAERLAANSSLHAKQQLPGTS